jgi:P4 family phage/plasmid primase-like protien
MSATTATNEYGLTLRQLPSVSVPVKQEPLREESKPAFEGFEVIALRNAALGYRVFPVDPLKKKASIKKFPELATCENLERIKEWATRFPNASCGLLATREGHLFIDEDASDEFRSGYETFAGEPFPVSRTTESRPNHRQSHWVQTDYTRENLRNITQDKTKDSMFSLRFHNYLVLGQGSQHPSGLLYRVVVDSPAIPMPDKLVDFILSLLITKRKVSAVEPTSRPNLNVSGPDGERVPPQYDVIFEESGHGRNSGVSAYAWWVYQNKPREVLASWVHQYNDEHCVPPLEKKEVDDIIHGKLDKPVTGSNAILIGGVPASQSPVAGAAITAKPQHRWFANTDMGNAERLVEAYGDLIRFCDETGKWFVWNGKLWEPAGKTGPLALMQKVARGIREEAERMKPDSDSEEDIKKADKALKTALIWAKKSESNAAVQAAISQARANSRIRVQMNQFDADRFLLNLANGTLNLQKGEFREHRREDLMTRISPVAFDPSATCPKWLSFLNVSVPDAGTQRFLQQGSGYSLTGSTAEDCLFLNHGDGRNGKGVFLNVLKFVLGDYCAQANFDSFTAGKGTGIQIRTDIARLAGARMVTASENEQDKRLAEGLLKTLTGSDTITARRLYEEEREFLPQFKLWFAVNHKPRIIGVDEGIWSRIHLIPWNVFIPEAKRIKNLRETIIAEEASGVLNWMLAGLRDYQEHGLVRSAEIAAATEDFRKESDQIQRFLNERAQIGEGLTVQSSLLYATYKNWTDTTTEFTVKDREFRHYLESKGFKSKRTLTAIFWLGIGLKPSHPDCGLTLSKSTSANEEGDAKGDEYAEVPY